MIRHGEDEFDKQNLFCGWYDAQLTPNGIEEAKRAGTVLKGKKYHFDTGFSSLLQRAVITLQTILNEMNLEKVEIHKHWQLNERHYGSLTGQHRAKLVEKHGKKQVNLWRRSYQVPPPPMDKDHPLYNDIRNNPIFNNVLTSDDFPVAESLELAMKRTLPFWNEVIVPVIKSKKKVIVSAHGNSLRGIVSHLDSLSESQLMDLNIPNAIPFSYIVDVNMKPIPGGSLRFLGDDETVKMAIEKIQNKIFQK